MGRGDGASPRSSLVTRDDDVTAFASVEIIRA
jgi:hypothetical protein